MEDLNLHVRSRSVPALPVALLLAVALLAGCILPEDTVSPPPASTDVGLGDGSGAGAGPTLLGTLRVVVLTPELDRIDNATVTVGNTSALTDGAGIATLSVPPGNHTVNATKDGFRTAKSGVSVAAGETTDVKVKLFPGADAPETPPEDQVYTREYDYTGVFECSLTYLIITGDCLLVADHILNETAGLPVRPGDATEDQNFKEFPLDAQWESVVVEMAWEAPLAPMGEKMQLALEPAEAPEEGHAPKYARVTGGSPLTFTLQNGVPHETASASADGDEPEMPNPAGGEVVMARAYVLGEAHNPGGTTFLGVGGAYSQKFDIYITVFYGEPAPDGYSRMPA